MKNWFIDKTGYKVPYYPESELIMSGDLSVAIVMGDNNKPAEKNANLISAAPDLLEALELLLDDYESSYEILFHGKLEEDKKYIKAKDAIAKAKGL